MKTAQIKSTLFESLKEAGAILKKSLHERRVVHKKSELSLVTATDKAAEKKILQVIGRAFPSHAILTEESPPIGRSDSRWIIDPLDGTTNFAHTCPVACVSIAFEDHGEVLLGGVYDPFRDELFFAEKGKGTTLNKKKIHVSTVKSLAGSLLCTGFPYDRRLNPDQYLVIVKAFMMKVHGVRRTGSAALDLCYVASGRFDGYWEFKLNAWDKAAGMLIVQEAGGKLSDCSGNGLTLDSVQNVATNGKIHREMLEVLAPFKNTCL